MVSVEGEEFSHAREMVELVDLAMRRFISTGRPEKRESKLSLCHTSYVGSYID